MKINKHEILKENTMNFTTIKNGVDERLTIIKEIQSGFYNITKTASQIHELKYNQSRENSPGIKDARSWFRTQQAQILISAFAEISDYQPDELHFKVLSGSKEYQGTYVHPKLYDHFVAWVDPKYAILISEILNKYHADANKKIIQEKDDKIDKLSIDIQELKKQNEQQSAELKQLMIYTKDSNSTIKSMHKDIKHISSMLNNYIKMIINDKTSAKVFSTIINEHSKEKKFNNQIEQKYFPGVKLLKVLVFVVFYNKSNVVIYAINRNFNELFDRLRRLEKKFNEWSESDEPVIVEIGNNTYDLNNGGKYKYFTKSISLMSGDVNQELSDLKKTKCYSNETLFNKDFKNRWNGNFKKESFSGFSQFDHINKRWIATHNNLSQEDINELLIAGNNLIRNEMLNVFEKKLLEARNDNLGKDEIKLLDTIYEKEGSFHNSSRLIIHRYIKSNTYKPFPTGLIATFVPA